MKRAALLIVLPLLLLFVAAARLSFAQTSIPTIISHQGRLLNASNQPVTTNVSVVFAIYDASSGGNQVWTETQSITPDNLGFYDTFLGGSTALPATLPNPSYLQIQIQSETLSPRLQFGSVPFAQRAGAAADLDCTGCLTNADVSGTAAIAGTKISPDFGSQNILTQGNIGIGTVSPTEKLEVIGHAKANPVVGRWTPTNADATDDNYAWGNEIFNTDSSYLSRSSDNKTIIVNKAGYYLVAVNVLQNMSGNCSSTCAGHVQLRKNSYVIARSSHAAVSTWPYIKHTLSIMESYNAGDEIGVYTDPPGKVYAVPQWSSLEIYRLN